MKGYKGGVGLKSGYGGILVTHCSVVMKRHYGQVCPIKESI